MLSKADGHYQTHKSMKIRSGEQMLGNRTAFKQCKRSEISFLKEPTKAKSTSAKTSVRKWKLKTRVSSFNITICNKHHARTHTHECSTTHLTWSTRTRHHTISFSWHLLLSTSTSYLKNKKVYSLLTSLKLKIRVRECTFMYFLVIDFKLNSHLAHTRYKYCHYIRHSVVYFDVTGHCETSADNESVISELLHIQGIFLL